MQLLFAVVAVILILIHSAVVTAAVVAAAGGFAPFSASFSGTLVARSEAAAAGFAAIGCYFALWRGKLAISLCRYGQEPQRGGKCGGHEVKR